MCVGLLKAGLSIVTFMRNAYGVRQGAEFLDSWPGSGSEKHWLPGSGSLESKSVCCRVTALACDGRGDAGEKEPPQEEGPVESETLV